MLDEAGGHRWQRVPPTEKKGRVQTSTVTVAVLERECSTFELNEKDLEYEYFRSGGPGGQHQNKTSSGVRVRHIPTGITAESRGRSQKNNRRLAREEVQTKLVSKRASKIHNSQNRRRKNQIGSGMRGDKIRTYRVRDDKVVDHRTNKKARLSSLLKGDWSDLK